MKICKNKECKIEFNPVTALQKYCFSCTVLKSKQNIVSFYQKKEKIEKKALKHSLKAISNYKNDLQKEINKTARLIDYGQVCISCQKEPKKINGCHFHSVGSTPALRFNLLNIYLGCEHCNSFKGGNVHGFDNGIIKTFGREFWEQIKFELPKKYSILQMKKHEIIEAIKKAREINRYVANVVEVLSSEQRIEIRQILNEQIGIYK